MSITKKWPGVYVTESDAKILDRIKKSDGILHSADNRDILLIAATIAAKQNASEIVSTEKKEKMQIHPDTLNKQELSDYRQYLLLIYYITAGNKKLQNMNDTGAVIKNFEDYAQRGLRIMEQEYLTQDGSDNFLDNYIDTLSGIFPSF